MHASHFLIRTYFAAAIGVMTFCAGFVMLSVTAGIPVTSAAKTVAKSAGYGSHGMAVFGGANGLYASHLPMFHQPHDVQLVFRFHLKDASVDAALRKQLTATPALWTLDPEKFDLNRFAPQHAEPLTQFQTRFVEGHFERGGLEKFAKQTVIVDEVIAYRKLDMAKRDETAGRYLKIDSKQDQFLIKLIDRRPDFDIIVALNSLETPDNRASTSTLKELTMLAQSLESPTIAMLQATLATQTAKGDAMPKVSSILYFETDDLK